MLEDLCSLRFDDGGYIWNFKFNVGKSDFPKNVEIRLMSA